MPLYEYICRECRCEAELLVRSSGQQPHCPQCGSSQLEKQLSLPVAHGSSASSQPDREPPSGPCGGSCACFPGG